MKERVAISVRCPRGIDVSIRKRSRWAVIPSRPKSRSISSDGWSSQMEAPVEVCDRTSRNAIERAS